MNNVQKNILIITTGGTIAMQRDSVTGELTQAISGKSLVAGIPQLEHVASIQVKEFSNTPSEYMTPSMMLRLAQYIQEIDHSSIHGYVITHGTDTMEETAFLLNHVVNVDKPICITGSMRGADALSADGPANLLAAVVAAASEKTQHMGVLVVMNNEIFLADEVIKSHTTASDAFCSNVLGSIGKIFEGEVYIRNVKQNKFIVASPDVGSNVWIVTCGAGMDSTFCESALTAAIDGLVVEGFGCGNVPLGMVKGLRKLVQEGIPVILCSRTHHGYITKEYGGEGGVSALEKDGIILSGHLVSSKARILLLLLIGAGYSINEMRTVYKLFS